MVKTAPTRHWRDWVIVPRRVRAIGKGGERRGASGKGLVVGFSTKPHRLDPASNGEMHEKSQGPWKEAKRNGGSWGAVLPTANRPVSCM